MKSLPIKPQQINPPEPNQGHVSQEGDSPLSGTVPKKAIPPYLLHNDWEKEMNYKLWVTKGARFAASNRCRRQNYWSKLSLNMLNAYLIILGLLPFFLVAASQSVSWEMVGIAVTGVSILAMVWGMHESGEQFELKAHRFHECALAISRLYNKLRQAKHLPEAEKLKTIRRISASYDDILAGYENHEPLDYDLFKLQKPEYFELNRGDVCLIKIKALIFTRLVYLSIVVVPMVGIIWLFGTELKAAKHEIRSRNQTSQPASQSPKPGPTIK